MIHSTRLNYCSRYEIIQLWVSLYWGPACGHIDLKMSGIFLCIHSLQHSFQYLPAMQNSGVSLQHLIPPTLPLRVKFIKECQNGRKGCRGKGHDPVGAMLLLKNNASENTEHVSFIRWQCLRCMHGLMTDCIVWTTLRTSNTSCKISVILAMNYHVFVAWQRNSIAMGAK